MVSVWCQQSLQGKVAYLMYFTHFSNTHKQHFKHFMTKRKVAFWPCASLVLRSMYSSTARMNWMIAMIRDPKAIEPRWKLRRGLKSVSATHQDADSPERAPPRAAHHTPWDGLLVLGEVVLADGAGNHGHTESLGAQKRVKTTVNKADARV